RNLTINTAGTTRFNNPVGSLVPISTLTTDADGTTAINGGAVTTNGDQTYNDAVTLGANTILASTGGSPPAGPAAATKNVTLANTVDGAFSLEVDSADTTTFGGAVGGTTALTSVTTDAAGSTAINGAGVTTTGAQTYNDQVTLGADATLTSTGSGNISLASVLDGAFNLTVNTAGTTTYG